MDAALLQLATTTKDAAVTGMIDVVTDFYPIWIPIMLGLAVFFYIKRRMSGGLRGSVKI